NGGHRRADAAAVRRAELHRQRTEIAEACDTDHWQHRDGRTVAQRFVALEAESGSDVAGVAPSEVGLSNTRRRPSADYRRKRSGWLGGRCLRLRTEVEHRVLCGKCQRRGEIVRITELGDTTEAQGSEIGIASSVPQVGSARRWKWSVIVGEIGKPAAVETHHGRMSPAVVRND